MGKHKISTILTTSYAHTDKMKRVYYSRYLEYFEIGRTDYLKNQYIRYKLLEDHYDVYMPVIESYTKYIKPIEYDTELKLITSFEQINHYKFKFIYELYHNEYIVAEGYTVHCFINSVNEKISFKDFINIINK